MAYNAISPSQHNPDSQLDDLFFQLLRDNWDSICSADDTDSPKIMATAIEPPSPGYNWVWSAGYNGPLVNWSQINNFGAVNWLQTGEKYYRWQAWKTGSMRFWLSVNRSITSQPANMQVYRNDAPYSAVYTCPAGQASANFVFDLSFNIGDRIDVYAQSQNSATFGCLAGMVANPFAYVG